MKKNSFIILITVIVNLMFRTNLMGQTSDTLIVFPINDTTSITISPQCGVDSTYLDESISRPITTFGPSLVSGYLNSAIDTCGKIAVYYDDLNVSSYIGFDDRMSVGATQLGHLRRNLVCQVLSYVQSVIDFSKVSYSNLVKLHVKVSYGGRSGYHAPTGTRFFAQAAPIFNLDTNAIIGGFLNYYVTTGLDTATSFHAEMRVNFDEVESYGTAFYQNDTSAPYVGCTIDLYSVILHEIGHALGWISLIQFRPAGGAIRNLPPNPMFPGYNAYSKLDTSISVGDVFPTASVTKLVTIVSGVPTLNSSLLCNGNYWINSHQAPENEPVFAGSFLPQDASVVKSYMAHLDDNQIAYTMRQHMCPGDRQEYVMGPFSSGGVKRREFTKGELQTFCNVLGYHYIGADSVIKLANHRPFSKKMAGYNMLLRTTGFADTVSADTTVFNNGTTISFNMATLVSKGDAYDADGDVISIDTSTVVNFRGGGDTTGNNHNLLSFSGGNTILSYTPRRDFYGRAQFGFNLTDGKENGSFYVLTIDVQQGLYPTYTFGENMVINGAFENGTEMKVKGSEHKHHTLSDQNGLHEGKWFGDSWSDGHPFNTNSNVWAPMGSGIAVKDNFIKCDSSLSGQYTGAYQLSFPTLEIPLTDIVGGKRYQVFAGSGYFSYYNLKDSLKNCHYYNLQFDVYKTKFIASPPSDIPIKIGFKDNTSFWLTPTFDHVVYDTMLSVGNAAWTHVTIPFWYCGSHPSHLMFIQGDGGEMAIDNLYLKEDTALPPLTVTLTQSIGAGCTKNLIPIVSNKACQLSYLWSGPGILSSITDSIAVVSSTVTATYSVTVNDGCRNKKTTINVVNTAPSAITGTKSVCMGFTTTLSDSPIGGIWSSSATVIATITSGGGIVSAVSPGTAIITYDLSGCSATTTVTVIPALPPIAGIKSICTGSSTALTNAITTGYWTSSSPTTAAVGITSGIVLGMAAGTATITYTAGSCSVTTTVTVNTAPTISGTLAVCSGATTTLSNAVAGTWMCYSPTIATIGISTGVVAGILPGTAIIYFTTTAGCGTIVTVTVNAIPVISGPDAVCNAANDTLTETIAGGTWSSSDPSKAVVGLGSGIVTGVGTGTTTITYTLLSGCLATYTITAYHNDSACSPCNAFGAFYEVGKSGSISADLPRGNYYLTNNATVYGSRIFSNAVIFVSDVVGMNIDTASFVIIDTSHLYSCNMWQGITLNSGALQSARLFVKGGSLIEDATTAVYIPNAKHNHSTLLFSSDNAIFNRNYVSLDIQNYSDLQYPPFKVCNTVFTSRDLRASMPIGMYPKAWPPTTGSFGLKTAWGGVPDIYTAPINIENPFGSHTGGAYARIACKNGSIPYCGIKLINVGKEILTSTVVGGRLRPSNYMDMPVGDDSLTTGNVYQNLFDNMMVGIYSYNSNLTVTNSVFNHMEVDGRSYAWPSVPPPSGDGIYAAAVSDANNQKQLQVYTKPGSTYYNMFYGFGNGVECYNYSNIVCKGNYMINKAAVGSMWMPAPPSGFSGYRISTPHYYGVDISNNTICNVKTGIGFWAVFAAGRPIWFPYHTPSHQYAGPCIVSNNTMVVYHAPGAITADAMQNAIAIQNTLTPYSRGSIGAWGDVKTNNNIVTDAYNGIFVNNFFKQRVLSYYNHMNIWPKAGSVLQTGINHTLNYHANMYDNYVGTSVGGPISGDNLKAYYSEATTATGIQCNTAENTGRGFEFILKNPGSLWWSNEMQNNQKGMVLNGGLIGIQRHFPTGVSGVSPTGNKWFGTWPAGNWQTYVYHGSDAIYNTLYLAAGTTTNPANNYGFPSIAKYDMMVGSLMTVTGSSPICPFSGYPSEGDIPLYEAMVRQNILYANNTVPNNWTAQFELWKTVSLDTALIDSSVTIAQFATMAQNSRYAYLTNIETQIAEGNYDSAAIMLGYDIDSMANTTLDTVTGVHMADSTAADSIVINYQNYYRLYLKYIDTNLNNEDSLAIMAMAQLCPQRNGYVVFQARALYSFIYNDINAFNDDSCLDADSAYRAEARPPANPETGIKGVTKVTQQYVLFPNPNDGNISLQQLVSDTSAVTVEVLDIVGRRIYKGKLLFSDKNATVQLGNVIPGMYTLQIKDVENRVFRFKFVIR